MTAGNRRAQGLKQAMVLGAAAFAALASLPTGAAASNSACVTADSSTATSCTYTTSGQNTFIVPSGVTSIQVVVTGASGGSPTGLTDGGDGAKIAATLAVSGGATLYTEVGIGMGPGYTYMSIGEGNGGGESDIRSCAPGTSGCHITDGTASDPRRVVAGGGGGGGSAGGGGGAGGAAGGTLVTSCDDGGNGGGAFGGAGQNGQACATTGGTGGSGAAHCSGAGGGGGASMAGSGAGGSCNGSSGSDVSGGGSATASGGGGGGAGFVGGIGGTEGGAGGGGSSFIEAAALQSAVLSDGAGAQASITISWSTAPNTPEVPMTILEVVVGLAVIGGVVVLRRRDTRATR